MTKSSTQLFNTYGHFKVVIATRQYHTEYQVRWGNRIIARHPSLHLAVSDAKMRLDQHWTDLGNVVRELKL